MLHNCDCILMYITNIIQFNKNFVKIHNHINIKNTDTCRCLNNRSISCNFLKDVIVCFKLTIFLYRKIPPFLFHNYDSLNLYYSVFCRKIFLYKPKCKSKHSTFFLKIIGRNITLNQNLIWTFKISSPVTSSIFIYLNIISLKQQIIRGMIIFNNLSIFLWYPLCLLND